MVQRKRFDDPYAFEDPFQGPGLDLSLPTMPTSTYSAPGYDAGMTQARAPSGGTAVGAPLGLEGFDAGKLADPTHASESPKYAFASIFNGAAPEQFGTRFAQLQQQYPDFFGGWSLNGDKLAYTDQSKPLNPAFEGWTGFDIARAFSGEGGPQGLQWMGTTRQPGEWGGNTTGSGMGPYDGYNPGPYDIGGGAGAGGGGTGPTSTSTFSGGGGNVGTNPFSQMIDQGFANFLSANNDIVQNGGMYDPQVTLRRMETARETGDTLRKSETANLRGALADRGLLAEPGYGSGPERTGLERIETQQIAPLFAQAARDIGTSELERADTRFANASNAMLGGLQAGTTRQGTLSSIALQALGQNMEWNKFLAQYGLDRDKFLFDAQNGKIENYMPIISLFLQYLQNARGGYV